ncbi:hypothetical protein H4219_006477, partial [Mycoemilia scoparia]
RYKGFAASSTIDEFISLFVPHPDVYLTFDRAALSAFAILGVYAYYKFINRTLQYTAEKESAEQWFIASFIITDLVLSAWIGEGNLAASAIPILLVAIY